MRPTRPGEADGDDPTRNGDVWLVVPCFNEGTVIEDVLRSARETFPNIVAVDDGSSDDSAMAIHRAGAHLVRHPVNLGQGAAIQTGVEYARSRPGAAVFATFDADGQHRVKDVMRMIDRLTAEHLDIVVGTRFGGQVSERMPALRRVLFPIIAKLSPASRKLGLTDAHNGLRVFNRTVADSLNITMNGMSHASEFVELMDSHGWQVAEEPVDILYTEYSMSKGQSLLNGINILSDGIVGRRLP